MVLFCIPGTLSDHPPNLVHSLGGDWMKTLALTGSPGTFSPSDWLAEPGTVGGYGVRGTCPMG